MRGVFTPRPAPEVIITGMPKSGTTAVARLMGIASGKNVVSDPFNVLDNKAIQFRDRVFSGEVTIGDLVQRYASVFRGEVIKDPNFIFFAEDLTHVFPDASWIFTVRDPRDNIRSVLNRLGLPGRISGIDLDNEKIGATWRRVLSGQTPNIKGRDPIHRLALRWNMMAQTALESDRMIISVYEAFNADKEGAIQKLCDLTGLGNLHSIRTHMDKQFQPKGDSNAAWGDFFGNSELETILKSCQPLMSRLGYGDNGWQR